jgi:hypothetical protein
MRKWMLAGSVVGVCAICGSASAQGMAPDFGAQGQLAISAERLFGIDYARASLNPPGNAPGWYQSTTIIGFGWSYQGLASSFVQPRAGIDYFVANRLSLGTAIGLYSGAGHNPQVGDTGFLFAPRVGYAIDLGSVASFWPRGGLTYYSHGDYHNVGLTGEANFALFPRPNWAFLITPHFDMGPFGGGPGDVDYTEFAIGIQLGLMGVI